MSEQIQIIIGVSPGEYLKPVYKTIDMEQEYTKICASDIFIKMEKIERSSRMLLAYLTKYYPSPIHTGMYFNDQYNKWLMANGYLANHANTIGLAFVSLRDSELVLQVSHNVYEINPRWLYRGSNESRIAKTKELYEAAAMYRHHKEQRKKLKQAKKNETTDTGTRPVHQDPQANRIDIPHAKEQAFSGDDDFSLPIV